MVFITEMFSVWPQPWRDSCAGDARVPAVKPTIWVINLFDVPGWLCFPGLKTVVFVTENGSKLKVMRIVRRGAADVTKRNVSEAGMTVRSQDGELQTLCSSLLVLWGKKLLWCQSTWWWWWLTLVCGDLYELWLELYPRCVWDFRVIYRWMRLCARCVFVRLD